VAWPDREARPGGEERCWEGTSKKLATSLARHARLADSAGDFLAVGRAMHVNKEGEEKRDMELPSVQSVRRNGFLAWQRATLAESESARRADLV
jgi:hypothetical protein